MDFYGTAIRGATETEAVLLAEHFTRLVVDSSVMGAPYQSRMELRDLEYEARGKATRNPAQAAVFLTVSLDLAFTSSALNTSHQEHVVETVTGIALEIPQEPEYDIRRRVLHRLLAEETLLQHVGQTSWKVIETAYADGKITYDEYHHWWTVNQLAKIGRK